MMAAAFICTYFLGVSAMLVIFVCLGIGLADLALAARKGPQSGKDAGPKAAKEEARIQNARNETSRTSQLKKGRAEQNPAQDSSSERSAE